MRLRAWSGLTVAAVLVGVLAGCTADPDPVEAAPTESSPPPSTAPSAPADDEPSAPPTCETLLTPAMIRGFTSLGWSAQSDPFILGDNEIDGLLCKWADYEAPNSNEVQIYGWGRLDADEAADAQELLVAQGWRLEEVAEGTLVSEDPAFAVIVDENGYGMSYLFGDGWVIVADTRQNLVLIDRPA